MQVDGHPAKKYQHGCSLCNETTHKILVVNKFEELDNQRSQKLVVSRGIVGKSESNGGDNSSSSVARICGKSSL